MLKTVVIPARTGLRVRCKCGYEWTYGGKSNFYASCPKCHSTVVFKEKRKPENDKNKNGGAV